MEILLQLNLQDVVDKLVLKMSVGFSSVHVYSIFTAIALCLSIYYPL